MLFPLFDRLIPWPVVLVAVLCGCTDSQGSAPGYPTSQKLRTDFPNLEIRRIGDYSPVYADYQDAAIVHALDRIMATGVTKARIEGVTAESAAARPSFGTFGMFRLGWGVPAYHKLWVKVADCGSSIYFRASGSGSLQTMDDKSNCLTETEGAPDLPSEEQTQ